MHVAEKSIPPSPSLSHPIIYFVLASPCQSPSLSLSVGRWECECSGTFFALSLTALEDFERAAGALRGVTPIPRGEVG